MNIATSAQATSRNGFFEVLAALINELDGKWKFPVTERAESASRHSVRG